MLLAELSSRWSHVRGGRHGGPSARTVPTGLLFRAQLSVGERAPPPEPSQLANTVAFPDDLFFCGMTPSSLPRYGASKHPRAIQVAL
jgi:hypothetical protein